MAVVGPPIERLLRTVYDRDESFQLLLTFALVLMFQDVLRFIWGANPQSLDNVQLVYGKIAAGDFIVPVYNLLVIAAAIGAAVLIGLFLQRTNYGRLLRATAENRTMAEALGVNVRSVYAVVFTLGTLLGTVGGALVVPTAAASLDMAVEFVIEAFAVVVIGGLGSMSGRWSGALLVGLIRAGSLVVYPEFEILAIYLIVIGVLLLKPSGPVRKARGMTRGAALLLLVAAVAALGLVPVLAPPVLRQPAGAVLRLRHRAAGLQPAVRLRRPALLRARHVPRARRLRRRRHRRRARASSSSRSCSSARRLPASLVALPVGWLVRALHRHLLRHAHAGLRHADALVPVQVLSPDRRRQRHARAPHAPARARVRRLQQDRAAGRPLLLLLPGAAGARRARHVAHRALARSGCTCARCATTRRRPSTWACACASSGWPPSSSPRSTGRSAAPSWASAPASPTPSSCYWTHSGHLVFMTVLGGFTSFLGPIVGALALTLLQDQLQSDHAILALRARRHPRRRRHLPPARPRRPRGGDRNLLQRTQCGGKVMPSASGASCVQPDCRQPIPRHACRALAPEYP